MCNRIIRGKSGFGPTRLGVLCLLVIALVAGTALGKETSEDTTAEQLVENARQAQLDGDHSRYFSLLREAVRIAPEYELARWQLGQLKIEDEWLAVEEAQRRAAADPRQAEYRQRRKAVGEDPQGQLELARWSRRNGLNEEARFHWASVLAIAPNHEEALRALGMRWHDGQLLTYSQIRTAKERKRELRRDAERWKARIANWERAVAGMGKLSAQNALEEIGALSDSDAIPTIEGLTLRAATNARKSEQRRQIALAVVKALGKMNHQDATESLIRHALGSPQSDVRANAVEQLRYRPLHDYVPILLGNLTPEIDSWFNITTASDGSVHYQHSLYLEGTEAKLSRNVKRAARQLDLGMPTITLRRDGTYEETRESDASVAARKAAVAAVSQRQFVTEAFWTEQRIAQQNEATSAANERIIQVLAATTGQNLGNDPNAWADWWRDHNEYYSDGEPPAYDQNYVDNRYFFYRFPEVRRTSCFAKGTLVWTKTGQRPIEELEMGDLVLSQNVDTGELTYQPVIGRTVRPPSPIVKLSLGGEELRTTLGHPLWVAGVGWRMAKELDEGAILHGVTGSPRVELVAHDGEEEAYNLVVAEFNTYFVGESGVLVHDNTPRRPTRATVLGLVAR